MSNPKLFFDKYGKPNMTSLTENIHLYELKCLLDNKLLYIMYKYNDTLDKLLINYLQNMKLLSKYIIGITQNNYVIIYKKDIKELDFFLINKILTINLNKDKNYIYKINYYTWKIQGFSNNEIKNYLLFLWIKNNLTKNNINKLIKNNF